MTKTVKKTKTTRAKYNTAFRTEALALADRIGVAQAAKQLDLHESQIYNWRMKSKLKDNTSEREQVLAAEVARLKRQLADQAEEMQIVKKAAAYFAKSLK